jgi:hypothetical protein
MQLQAFQPAIDFALAPPTSFAKDAVFPTFAAFIKHGTVLNYC